jgi:hypothetical protein
VNFPTMHDTRCFQCGLSEIHRVDCLNSGYRGRPIERAQVHIQSLAKLLRLELDSRLPVFEAVSDTGSLIRIVCEYYADDVKSLAAIIASSREGMLSPSLTSELASRRTAHNVAVKAAVNARLVSVPRID